MESTCPFQPQINPRSRRLARHAPTLRERQEQDEQRRSAGREDRPGLPQRGQPTARARAQAFTKDTESDIVESVWDLWRGVAIGEAREAEVALLSRAHSVNGDRLPQRRPRVVYVTTVLGMLRSLGVTSPQHDALIAKFLAAMAVEGSASEALKRDETVDAARFMYVFSTVWRVAVTNCTLSSPASARVSMSPRSPSAAQQRGDPAGGATIRHHCAGEGSPRGVSPSRMQAARAPVPASLEVASSGSRSLAGSARPLSSPSLICSGGEDSEGESYADFESAASSTTSSGSDGEENSVAAERDSDFLRTSISDASSSASDSAEKRDAGVRTEELSPVATKPSGRLDPSPEPHQPAKPVNTTPTHPIVTPCAHHCSPFAAASRLCSAAVPHSRRTRSSLRVIPSDSHLLWSTTSRELKKTTKCVPGGLMRECTFKPVINPAYEQSPVRSSSAAVVQRRKPASSPLPTFQLNAQRFHQARNSSVWCTKQSLHESGGNQDNATAVSQAAGVKTAVSRMIAARRQWLRLQAPTPNLSKTSHLSMPAQQSAVRARVAHPRKPLLYVDVDLPQGGQDRLALYAGDDVEDVAQRFSILHGLSSSLRQRLATALTTELRALSLGMTT
ncbi:hypothetical protein JIQ42_00462 [Leishmania sp. Namibia]|uniref:hypothetical protein n=1 Tax=Leishmania sp. Namibia TaxID=2802991 RepID=UPI001B5CDA17|nr:hypothetical protein JIQ42_00462 [Leishmania sp. Namibia]